MYWVTVVLGDGSVVRMACWKGWRLSESVCSPHVRCRSCRLVNSVPWSLYVVHLSGKASIWVLSWWALDVRVSTRWVIVWV